MSIVFFLPFVTAIGVAVLGAVVESVTKEGQQLGVHQGVFLPFRGISRAILHFGKYMHHIYLGCFAYDLAALTTLNDSGPNPTLGISYGGKPVVDTAVWLVLGVIVHITAFFHTTIINREVEAGRAKRPITYLHLFVYLPLSIVLLVLVRL